jgi:hypothetical protein
MTTKNAQQQRGNNSTPSAIVEQIDGTYYTFDTANCALMRGIISYTTTKKVTINKYIKSISIMSRSTAHEYWKRLNSFQVFIGNEYRILSIDDLISKIKRYVGHI